MLIPTMVIKSGTHIINTFVCRPLMLQTRSTSMPNEGRREENVILILMHRTDRERERNECNLPFVAIQLTVNNATHREINPLQLIVIKC